MKHPIAILGAGRMGRSIAEILHASGRYETHIADRAESSIQRLPEALRTHTAVVDVHQPDQLANFLRGKSLVISACSFTENPTIARAALELGLSYFDLTEDVACTQEIRKLAAQAQEGQVFVPQCGLAPGFIGIAGHDMARRFERVQRLKLRVGALPLYPANVLKYNLTWSTMGLVNEYCHPCIALRRGEITQLQPLEGLESFAIGGVDYEAFNTSGGLGTLCETLRDHVEELDYKSVRYPGHREKMHFLLRDLRMGESPERQQALGKILEDAIPATSQDKVLIFVSASGWRNGILCEESEVFEVMHKEQLGRHWTAIQRTTAAGVCVAVDLHCTGKLPKKGFIGQEDISFDAFMRSPFAECYAESQLTTTLR